MSTAFPNFFEAFFEEKFSGRNSSGPPRRSCYASVKSVELLRELVTEDRELVAGLQAEVATLSEEGEAHLEPGLEAACLQVVPELLFLLHVLRVAGLDGQHGGDGGDDLEVAEHIVALLAALQLREVAAVDHDPVDLQLLVDAPDHDAFIDRLIIAADEVVIEVHVHIVHLLYARNRLVDEDVIDVEGVLRQHEAAVAEHLRAVDDGVHQDVLSEVEVLHLVPAEDAVLRESRLVAHDLLMGLADLIVDEVTDEHVDRGAGHDELTELLKHLREGFVIEPVVGIDDLIEEAARIAETGIDRLPVAAVLLMHRLYDARVLRLVLLRDLEGVILLRAVVNDDDLHLVTTRKDRLNALPHIGGRVVAWYSKADKLHVSSFLRISQNILYYRCCAAR